MRALAATAAALALLAVSAPAAGAKVYFAEMGGRVLHWDQHASSTILGCPGNASCRDVVDGLTVYLRRGPLSPHGTPGGGHITRLGKISPRGTLAFRVPHKPAGRYHLVARVPAGSQRRWVAVSATFRIRSGS
jgi:hypothetical protein